jgi:hypothetical protein
MIPSSRRNSLTRLAVGYLIYLLLSIAITVFVGQTLHRHGRLFLIDVFHGNVPLADTVNHLLLVGFYLLNIALVLLLMRTQTELPQELSLAEFLADKLAVVFVTLGVMHFFNVAALMEVRDRIWSRPIRISTFLD